MPAPTDTTLTVNGTVYVKRSELTAALTERDAWRDAAIKGVEILKRTVASCADINDRLLTAHVAAQRERLGEPQPAPGDTP